MLSSIGDIVLPVQVRAKLISGEELTQVEREIYNSAPGLAKDLLTNVPRLEPIAEAVYYQNKGFDGSGFPRDNIQGHDIPFQSRLLCLLKNMLEISKGRVPNEDTFVDLAEKSAQFDPELLEAAHKCFLDIQDKEVPREENLLVMINQLLPGDLLLEDLRTLDGELALAANNEITKAMLVKVRQYHKLNVLKEPVNINRTHTNSSDQSAA